MKGDLALKENKNQFPSQTRSCPHLPTMCSWNLGLFQTLNVLESVSWGRLWSDHGALAAGESETNWEAGKQYGPLLQPRSDHHPQHPTPPFKPVCMKRDAREGLSNMPWMIFSRQLNCSYFVLRMTASLCCGGCCNLSGSRWATSQSLILIIYKLLWDRQGSSVWNQCYFWNPKAWKLLSVPEELVFIRPAVLSTLRSWTNLFWQTDLIWPQHSAEVVAVTPCDTKWSLLKLIKGI